MRKVTFQFKEFQDLRTFMQIVQSPSREINYADLTLVCECEVDEIEMAQKKFNASLIKVHTPA